MNVWGAQHNLDITILITFQTQSLSIDKMIKDKKVRDGAIKYQIKKQVVDLTYLWH